MKRFLLADLCVDLFTGIPGSFLQKDIDNTSTVFNSVNGSALTTQGEIDLAQLQPVQIASDKAVDKFKLLVGDVVLLSRGSSMKAALITAELVALNALPSANLIVMRPKQELVKSEVLVAYFNSVVGQAWLEQNSAGAAIRNLPAGELKKLEIALPELSVQTEIAELFHANLNAQKVGMAMLQQQKRVADACIQQLMQRSA